MRNKSAEEQALFLYFRNHLIEKGLMPIDKEGKAIDLSLLYIPAFDVAQIMDCQDKNLLNDVMSYYHINREDHEEIRIEDIIRCFNRIKTENPGTFMKLYSYLTETGLIPKSPILAELNLTPEHIDYLRKLETPAVRSTFSYFNNMISGALESKTGKTAVLWDIRNQSREWIEKHTPKINEYIAKMRFGDVDEQKSYHDLCVAISRIHNTIITEKPMDAERR